MVSNAKLPRAIESPPPEEERTLDNYGALGVREWMVDGWMIIYTRPEGGRVIATRRVFTTERGLEVYLRRIDPANRPEIISTSAKVQVLRWDPEHRRVISPDASTARIAARQQ